jgi:hypothetical protein
MAVTRETQDRRARRAAGLDGKLLTPEHPDFGHARRAWNLAVDQRPAAVVRVGSVDEISATVDFAQEHGLQVTAQGTGHGAAALGGLEDTVLLRTDRMREVRVDPTTQIVRVQAGVTWSEAVEAAGSHGLALLAGSAPDVGVVGYTVGGGLSWLGRRHGLACNSVEAVDLVTADGRLVRADAEHEPDLFWAIRGGGGSFGVVSAIELRAIPISHSYAGLLWWPIERAEEVLHCWRELTEAGLPDELTTVGRLMQLPVLPEVPEPLRGRSFVVVEAFHLGEPADADERLAPLRALGPENDTIDVVPTAGLSYLHMDPDHPVPFVGDGMLLAGLPERAIDKLLRIAGAGVASPLLSVEIRQLGGELGRAREENGALASIDASYAMYAVGMAPTPEAGRGVRAYVDHLLAGMREWSAPTMYMNFAETARGPVALWGELAYGRLSRIKAMVDPDDLIRGNHPIPPA